MATFADLKAVIERFRTSPQRCLLCGRKAIYAGTWFMDGKTATATGCAKGKTRAMVYALCKRHFKELKSDEDATVQIIESAIVAKLQAKNN